jgi:hypothetical protein
MKIFMIEHDLALDFSFILVVVELVLLVPTLLLLVLGRREERGRRELLVHITSMVKMVSRQEYFNSVHASMHKATKSICGIITGSTPKTKEEELVRGIIEEIHGATKRGTTVRYLIPKFHDRLQIAYLYKEVGAEIRFHPGLVVSDLRFVVVDGKIVVLGLPVVPGQDQPTREGFMIPSEALSEILVSQFEGKWGSGISYDDYVREALKEIKGHNPSVSDKVLSNQLQIPESELVRVTAVNDR